ncbi:MAG TPA: methyltransferase domain-containing protein [Polyangiaceae bacterium]|nr:methyltransferase domain-containing protein [Polyangiaceae bacterium]
MSNWYENDRFWEKTYPFMFPDARIDGTAAEMTDLLALIGESPSDVLDLCCGPGRASVELACRGARVTGVDRSAFMLEKARARATAAAVDVEWVSSDMRDFVRPESYDLALSLFTSFGYFEAAKDNARVLKNVRRSLRPGGKLAMDLINKERLARIFLPESCTEAPDGRLMLERRHVLPGWERIETSWYVMEDGRYETFTIAHWVYSAAELRRMLFDAGFSEVSLYGSYAGAPFVGDARLHVIAKA